MQLGDGKDMRTGIGSSPFGNFLSESHRLLCATPVVRDKENLAEYARVMEYRRFYIDILDRVEILGFAFSRVTELSPVYKDAVDEIEKSRRAIEDEPAHSRIRMS